MASLNKVTLIGNLGADPELKYTASGTAVCNIRIATTNAWKDKTGKKQEKTEWHRITVWGDMGENCQKYLSKGRSVYVEGRLETRSYEKDGEKKFVTDIIATQVLFLGGGKDSGQENGQSERGQGSRGSRQQPLPNSSAPPADDPIPDDDIPF